jgi:hypothetical protein
MSRVSKPRVRPEQKPEQTIRRTVVETAIHRGGGQGGVAGLRQAPWIPAASAPAPKTHSFSAGVRLRLRFTALLTPQLLAEMFTLHALSLALGCSFWVV